MLRPGPQYEVFPEPIVVPSANQFLVQLPPEALAVQDLKEWELYIQKSVDNVNWGDWGLLYTNPIRINTHVYQYADLVIPYYYRFRYVIRTASQKSAPSEAAYAGIARTVVLGENIEGQIDPEENIPPGGIVGELIAFNAITGNHITTGSINAGHIIAGEIDATHIASDSIETRHLQADAVTADKIIADAITADKIDANAIQAEHINTNQINNLHIGDNTINGVKLLDSSLTANKIGAHEITSDKLSVGFLDANVSHQAYIEAESIIGGELSLGGTATYTENFTGNDGELLFPWSIGGVPGKFTFTHADQKLRIALLPSTAYSAGDLLSVGYQRPNATNRITSSKFHLKVDLPANFIMELIDQNGAVIASYTKTGIYETSVAGTLDKETVTATSAAVAFSLRCTNNTTTGAGIDKFIEITTVEFEFERGYGNLNIFDAAGRLRAEMTANYIGFNKAVGASANRDVTITSDRTFLADEEGVWTPADGLTIGSSSITDLRYLLRDLSGNLCINPRMEQLKNITQGSSLMQVPSEWTYLYTLNSAHAANEVDDSYISTGDILPQRQSLVSGRTMNMNLQGGWDTDPFLSAVSHKRYVDADTNTPQMPMAMSSFFRITPDAASPADKDKVKVAMELRASNSPNDILSYDDTLDDTWLGYVELSGTSIGAMSVDGNILFQRLAHSYRLATTAGEMILTTTQGKYVYVILYAWCDTGTLTNDVVVEWDNVDLAIAEENTPSDSQPMAELGRKIGDYGLLITYAFSGTKCVLPELSTGTKGLGMTAVW